MRTDPDTFVIERADQQRALSSPIRLEILGHFSSPEGSAISDIARRMGRPASALYYHIGMLEKVGILRRCGTRPAGKRHEALFRPVAQRIELAADPDSEVAVTSALRTAAAAFRMAERDMEAALQDGKTRQGGDDRNFFAARMHCCVSRDNLVQINEHVNAIYGIVAGGCSEPESPSGRSEYCSITLALLPLRGRKPHPDNPETRSSK